MTASFDGSTATRHKWQTNQKDRWHSEGRPVRLAFVTWPVVALFGATVAAAACLLGECDCRPRSQADETLIAQSGSIKSLSFRPDGAILASLGVDGSIVLWDRATLAESSRSPRLSGVVRSAVFSPDNTLLATANSTATVAPLRPEGR